MLGYLEPVELHDVWADEARDFTPWLARPENLRRLGEVVNMDLELEGTEVPVGPYSADIVATDVVNGRVVIENQLGKTDHDHLGKLITYASGLKAKTMIWIAKEITEEHRSAIVFLNENSALNMRLYAIQMQVMKVGTSAPAPLFKVVASPNEYSEQAGAAELTETGLTYLAFWNDFKDYAQREGTFLRLRKPSPGGWLAIALGRSHFALFLTIRGDDKRVGCEIIIDGAIAKAAFQELAQQREEIEKSTGPLEWVDVQGAQRCKIALYRRDVDPLDRSIWPDLFKWLRQNAEAFQKAFAPRIKALPMEEAMAAPAEEA